MKALFVLLVILSFANDAFTQHAPKWVRTNHPSGVAAITVTDKSHWLVSTSVRSDEIIRWNGLTGAFEGRSELDVNRDTYGKVYITDAVVISGTDLVAIGTDSGLYLYDMSMMQIAQAIGGAKTLGIVRVASSSTGDSLLWVTSGGDIYRFATRQSQIIDALHLDRAIEPQYYHYGYPVLASPDLTYVVAGGGGDVLIADFIRDTTFKLYDPKYRSIQGFSDDGQNLIFNHSPYEHRDALKLSDLTFIDSFALGYGPEPRSHAVSSLSGVTYHLKDYMMATAGFVYSDIFKVKGNDTAQVTGMSGAIALDPLNPVIMVGSVKGSTSYSTDGLPLSRPALAGWDYGGLAGINYSYSGEFCGHRMGGDEMIEGYLYVGDWRVLNHIPVPNSCYNSPKVDPAAPRVAVGLDILRTDTTYDDYVPKCPFVTAEWTHSGSYYLWSSYNDTLFFQDRGNVRVPVLTGHREISDLAVSPDDQFIATCGIDSTIKLWSAKGELLQVISGHNGKVNDVNFSRNGRYVISASSDSTVRVWSLDGREIFRYDGFHEPFYQAEVSNDGLTVVAATDRSIVAFDAAQWASVKQTSTSQAHSLDARRVGENVIIKHSFNAEKQMTLEIYDLLGRLIYRSDYTGALITINTAGWTPQPLLFNLTQSGETRSALVPR